MVFVWYSVPKELTMSKEEAEKCYSKIAFNQIPNTLSNGVNAKGIPNTEERVMLRGALKYVIDRHKWYNSHTEGGYVETVAMRYLRRKHNNDFSQFDSMEDINLRDIVKALRKKYSMHDRTYVTVLKNIRDELFGFSQHRPLCY